jgi:5'-phosphate synthase pdxT subunit
MKRKVGVLALQGGVIEHANVLKKLGSEVIFVRTVSELQGVNALVMPGGESTTLSLLLQDSGLFQEIRQRASFQRKAGVQPLSIFGTCAGAILLAKEVKNSDGRNDRPIPKKFEASLPQTLELMDIQVLRNAYGEQIDSFQTELPLPELGISHLQATFIRAPIIAKVLDHKSVLPAQILGRFEEQIVLVQQGHLLAATFHPELNGETRLHEFFLQKVVSEW